MASSTTQTIRPLRSCMKPAKPCQESNPWQSQRPPKRVSFDAPSDIDHMGDLLKTPIFLRYQSITKANGNQQPSVTHEWSHDLKVVSNVCTITLESIGEVEKDKYRRYRAQLPGASYRAAQLMALEGRIRVRYMQTKIHVANMKDESVKRGRPNNWFAAARMKDLVEGFKEFVDDEHHTWRIDTFDACYGLPGQKFKRGTEVQEAAA